MCSVDKELIVKVRSRRQARGANGAYGLTLIEPAAPS
jgi:hypothetical protein